MYLVYLLINYPKTHQRYTCGIKYFLWYSFHVSVRDVQLVFTTGPGAGFESDSRRANEMDERRRQYD